MDGETRKYSDIAAVSYLDGNTAEKLYLKVFQKKAIATAEALSALFQLKPVRADQSMEEEGIIVLVCRRDEDLNDGLGSGQIEIELNGNLGEGGILKIKVKGEQWQPSDPIKFLRRYLEVLAMSYASIGAAKISENVFGAASYGAMEIEFDAAVNELPEEIRDGTRVEVGAMKNFI